MSAPLLTARQVGELLGMSPGTVLRWTRLGKLPALKLPSGAIRYRAEELERWLEAHSTNGEHDRSGGLTSADNRIAPARREPPGARTTEERTP